MFNLSSLAIILLLSSLSFANSKPSYFQLNSGKNATDPPRFKLDLDKAPCDRYDNKQLNYYQKKKYQ